MGARFNLSPKQRTQIVSLSEAAYYQRRIAADLHCNQAAVGDAIRRFYETGSDKDRFLASFSDCPLVKGAMTEHFG